MVDGTHWKRERSFNCYGCQSKGEPEHAGGKKRHPTKDRHRGMHYVVFFGLGEHRTPVNREVMEAPLVRIFLWSNELTIAWENQSSLVPIVLLTAPFHVPPGQSKQETL